MAMASLSALFSSSLPPRTHSRTRKSSSANSFPFLYHRNLTSVSDSADPVTHQIHPLVTKLASLNSVRCTKDQPHSPPSPLKSSSFLQVLIEAQVCLRILGFFVPPRCLASETVASPVADKVSLEAVLVSIDDFFNRYPFFVAGCTFIWLVVIPLTQEYLSKCKPISAIDAFRKLRDGPNAQLLDIRDKKTLVSLGSPNLKFLSKGVVQIQFAGEDEDRFVKKALERFPDPSSTVLCVLDNFDGDSLKAAELLFKNGFKEAYAIKGGVRGKKGWVAIQDTLLPPSVHIKPKTKKARLEANGGINVKIEDEKHGSPSASATECQMTDNEETSHSMKSESKLEVNSPYPHYRDLKPPSSPAPSKPR